MPAWMSSCRQKAQPEELVVVLPQCPNFVALYPQCPRKFESTYTWTQIGQPSQHSRSQQLWSRKFSYLSGQTYSTCSSVNFFCVCQDEYFATLHHFYRYSWISYVSEMDKLHSTKPEVNSYFTCTVGWQPYFGNKIDTRYNHWQPRTTKIDMINGDK